MTYRMKAKREQADEDLKIIVLFASKIKREILYISLLVLKKI